jgi:hypothetical protein
VTRWVDLLDEFGEISRDRLTRLSADDLTDLVTELLGDNLAESAGGQRDYQDRPHMLLEMLIDSSGVELRKTAGAALYSIVRDVCRDEPAWRGNSGDEALMAGGRALRQSDFRDRTIELLLARIDRVSPTNDWDHHWRALSTLLELGYRGSEEFWKTQLEVGGVEVLTPVVHGLGLVDPFLCAEWVATQEWSPNLERALTAWLPAAIDVNGPVVITHCFGRVQAQLESRIRTIIARFFEDADAGIAASEAGVTEDTMEAKTEYLLQKMHALDPDERVITPRRVGL